MASPDNVRLERVALHHGAAYVAMVTEHLASIEGYPYSNYPLAQVDFAAFVQELNDEAQGFGLPDGIPPQRTYGLVSTGDVIVGEFRLRPELKPPYDRYGGHIGYNIRPTYRRQDHATRARTPFTKNRQTRPRPSLVPYPHRPRSPRQFTYYKILKHTQNGRKH